MDPMVGDPLMDPSPIIHHAITCPNYRRAIPWTNSVQNISPNGMNRSSTSEPTTFVMSRRNYQLCLSTKDNLLWQFLGKTSIKFFAYLLGTDFELIGKGASICNLAWRCITPSCYTYLLESHRDCRPKTDTSIGLLLARYSPALAVQEPGSAGASKNPTKRIQRKNP